MPGYTERAVKVFLETGTRWPRRLIWAMGMVKYAAARANTELGLLDRRLGEAIMEAALRLARGELDDRIVVDVFQTGSGTGFNMNVNEVIAEEASRRLGERVHPNDHVNLGQSSNDTVPTAVRVAALAGAREVAEAAEALAGSLEGLAGRHGGLVKPGRTHLRDALPVTLGQWAESYALTLREDAGRIREAMRYASRVPLGGTAVGTGLNAHPDYPRLAIRILSEATGLPLEPVEPRGARMRLATDLAWLMAAYRGLALTIHRLGQDIRLLYSGPNTGIAEIDIPQAIPGSSMMPGKVNPVTVEAAMLAASHVLGLDKSLEQAALLGELELGLGWPLIAYTLDRAALLLAEASRKMADLVVSRIEPRAERMRRLALSSQALVTVLAPLIGYEEAARLSKRLGEGKTLREALIEMGYPEDWVDRVLDLERLTRPGIPVLEEPPEKKGA